MASCEFKNGKCHGGTEVAAYLHHQDISKSNRTRVLEAKKEQGKLCHIDPEKSHLNYAIYVTEKGMVEELNCGENYFNMTWNLYKQTIELIDSLETQTNKRKDRVTMQSIEIPFPPDLSGTDKETIVKGKQWVKRVIEIIYDHYTVNGEKPVILPGAVHIDEIHKYKDVRASEIKNDDVLRESVTHLHLPCIPYSPETGGLNGKWFSSRANMVMLNKKIQDMTVKEFGVNFLTGEKYKSRDTVEELKEKSAALEAEVTLGKKKLKEKKKQVEEMIVEIEEVQKEIPVAINEIVNLIQAQRKEAERKEVEKLEEEILEFLEQENMITEWKRFKNQKRIENRRGFGDFVYTLSKDQKTKDETRDTLENELDVIVARITEMKEKADKVASL